MAIDPDSGVSARHSAISKALEGIPEFGDDFKLPISEVKEPTADAPAEDALQVEAPAKGAEPAADNTLEKAAS